MVEIMNRQCPFLVQQQDCPLKGCGPPPTPYLPLPSKEMLQKTDDFKHESGAGFDGKVVIKKRQQRKWMKGIENRCRSAVEANPSCVHLNESEGDQTKWPLLSPFTIQAALSHSVLLKLLNFRGILHLSITLH